MSRKKKFKKRRKKKLKEKKITCLQAWPLRIDWLKGFYKYTQRKRVQLACFSSVVVAIRPNHKMMKIFFLVRLQICRQISVQQEEEENHLLPFVGGSGGHSNWHRFHRTTEECVFVHLYQYIYNINDIYQCTLYNTVYYTHTHSSYR